MTDFKQQYKNQPLSFRDANQRRIIRADKHDKSRKEVRTRAFDRNRKLQDISAPESPQLEDVPIVRSERMQKLIKWKTERDRKKRIDNAKKKPVFKVGIVHHSLYSPIARNHNILPNVSIKSSKLPNHPIDVKKRVTRATQKRLLAKAATSAIQQTIGTKNALTLAKHPSSLKKSALDNKQQKSFAPTDHKFRPPSGLPKMPLFGLVPIEQTPQDKGDFFVQKKLIEHATLNTNDKDISSQIISSNCNTSEPKKSMNQNLSSNKQRSPQNLNTNINDSNLKLSPNKRKSLQNLNRQISDSNKKELRLSRSINSKLSSNKRKSLRKLNEENHDSNDIPVESHGTVNTNLSLNEQRQLNNSLEEKPLTINNDTKTLRKESTNKSDKENCNEDLITFSPYLTLSRGKNNVRKEQRLRLGIGRSPSDEVPTKDNVMKNLNISIEEEERTAQYFKFLLNKETDRLKELCKKWMEIRLEKNIPEDAMYEISQAVGQTNLLINKKFERFRGLVLDCETGKGEMLVTCRDLQGFWDMTYMEVVNCDSRFEKLGQSREKGWQEEQCTVVKPIGKKRMPAKKQIVSAKPSSLRSLILAARKKKMTDTLDKEGLLLRDRNEHEEDVTSLPSNRKSVNLKCNTDIQHNTRRSKSLDQNECKSALTPRDSSKINLLQKAQFSGTSKKMKSPFAAMKISQMCKTPEIHLDNTISYVNSDQTPGKSILKKSEEIASKEIRMKSAHKVNFDDKILLSKVSPNKELQTKLSLAAALNRIDNLDLDEVSSIECINVERKLDFDSEDSDSFDNLEWTSEIKTQLKKEETNSKSPSQNVSECIISSFKNITVISCKKSSLATGNDSKTKLSRKNIRHRTEHKNTISPKDPLMNRLPATPSSINIENDAGVIPNLIMDKKDDTEVRILRNRTVTTHNTPKINRTNNMMTPKKEKINKKENKSPVKANRKSSLRVSQQDKNKHSTSNENNITNINESIDRKRRSSRKSVAFSAETCLVCVESKPTLPMTPHSKRRSKTTLNQSKHAIDEDLISWETPQRPPSRVTRSHAKV